MRDLFERLDAPIPEQSAPAPRARFKTLGEYRCEACQGSVEAEAGAVRVFVPEPGRTRAWCSPEHAVAAGWPWVRSNAA